MRSVRLHDDGTCLTNDGDVSISRHGARGALYHTRVLPPVVVLGVHDVQATIVDASTLQIIHSIQKNVPPRRTKRLPPLFVVCRTLALTYPLEMRVVPHFIFILSQPEDELEVDHDLVLVPHVRDVKPRVVRRDTMQEASVVDFDRRVKRLLCDRCRICNARPKTQCCCFSSFGFTFAFTHTAAASILFMGA